jgi:hypothetical protein
MLSADQVPIRSTHSKTPWPEWVKPLETVARSSAICGSRNSFVTSNAFTVSRALPVAGHGDTKTAETLRAEINRSLALLGI